MLTDQYSARVTVFFIILSQILFIGCSFFAFHKNKGKKYQNLFLILKSQLHSFISSFMYLYLFYYNGLPSYNEGNTFTLIGQLLFFWHLSYYFIDIPNHIKLNNILTVYGHIFSIVLLVSHVLSDNYALFFRTFLLSEISTFIFNYKFLYWFSNKDNRKYITEWILAILYLGSKGMLTTYFLYDYVIWMNTIPVESQVYSHFINLFTSLIVVLIGWNSIYKTFQQIFIQKKLHSRKRKHA